MELALLNSGTSNKALEEITSHLQRPLEKSTYLNDYHTSKDYYIIKVFLNRCSLASKEKMLLIVP